jgi:hypothetical protein
MPYPASELGPHTYMLAIACCMPACPHSAGGTGLLKLLTLGINPLVMLGYGTHLTDGQYNSSALPRSTGAGVTSVPPGGPSSAADGGANSSSSWGFPSFAGQGSYGLQQGGRGASGLGMLLGMRQSGLPYRQICPGCGAAPWLCSSQHRPETSPVMLCSAIRCGCTVCTTSRQT